jgi:magnesium-transporting ATPase (P-type)
MRGVGRTFHLSPNNTASCVNYNDFITMPQPPKPLNFLLMPFIYLQYFCQKQLIRLQNIKNKGCFIDNTIRTHRYSPYDFFPRQILFQFYKLGNLYFLFISALQAVPNWSPTGQFTTIVPLTFFVSLSMLKEGWEDYIRWKNDMIENDQLALKWSNGFRSVKWRELRVGDIIKVCRNEIIPADSIILASSDKGGECQIETSNLDGESNHKQKRGLDFFSVMSSLEIDIANISGEP